MTHGDRFRNLSDRKLANYLGVNSMECPPSCKEERYKCERCSTKYCTEQWYEYLSSEVEDKKE